MCAAKFERTGFMLRNAWPNFKHFANEQSASFAQSANESSSSFVRKNSKKAETTASAGAAAAGRLVGRRPHTSSAATAPACTSTIGSGASEAALPNQQLPGTSRRVPRVRWSSKIGTRPLAAELLRGGHAGSALAARAFAAQACSADSTEPAAISWGQHGIPSDGGCGNDVAAVPLPSVREERPCRGGASIQELVETASEKYTLNPDFWGKYEDIPSMAKASEKADILQIIQNFVLIHRKHVYLFQRLKNTVVKTLEHWSAPDLAALCHAWAQLGFLHEDLCIAMSPRVTATAQACSPKELCWLMDAYATARCSVQSVSDEIAALSLMKFDEFTAPQLCLHASSFARLNIHHEPLFSLIGERLLSDVAAEDCSLCARDLTLAAYSFAKLGFFFPGVFEAIASRAADVIRDFTSRDLQMLVVALARAQHRDSELLAALSGQAQRRIAQFNAESLTLTLRAMAFFGVADGPLFTRAVCQLPRAIATFRPADVTTLLSAFAAAQIHSLALFDVVTPYILERATVFTPTDWLGALRSYAALGYKDAAFLAALGIHLEPARLTLPQIAAALADCSRLSFAGATLPLVEAAGNASPPGGAGAAEIPTDVAAQMYSALLLLGHSGPSTSLSVSGAETCGEASAVKTFLGRLASLLRKCGAPEALSVNACSNLYFACLVAPPVSQDGSMGHPFDCSALLARCTGEPQALSVEDRFLLQHSLSALELQPWDRCALRGAAQLAALPGPRLPDATLHMAPYFFAGIGHLAPHQSKHFLHHFAGAGASDSGIAPSGKARETQSWQAESLRLQGVFAAYELRESLGDLSSALSACGVEHALKLPAPVARFSGPVAHIAVSRCALLRAAGHPLEDPASAQVPSDLAVLWGSSLHYVSTNLTALAPNPDFTVPAPAPRLSPAAQLQMATVQQLQAHCEDEGDGGAASAGDSDGEGVSTCAAVVVPHWWWPRAAAPEEKGIALVRFLLDGGRVRRRGVAHS